MAGLFSSAPLGRLLRCPGGTFGNSPGVHPWERLAAPPRMSPERTTQPSTKTGRLLATQNAKLEAKRPSENKWHNSAESSRLRGRSMARPNAWTHVPFRNGLSGRTQARVDPGLRPFKTRNRPGEGRRAAASRAFHGNPWLLVSPVV